MTFDNSENQGFHPGFLGFTMGALLQEILARSKALNVNPKKPERDPRFSEMSTLIEHNF